MLEGEGNSSAFMNAREMSGSGSESRSGEHGRKGIDVRSRPAKEGQSNSSSSNYSSNSDSSMVHCLFFSSQSNWVQLRSRSEKKAPRKGK